MAACGNSNLNSKERDINSCQYHGYEPSMQVGLWILRVNESELWSRAASLSFWSSHLPCSIYWIPTTGSEIGLPLSKARGSGMKAMTFCWTGLTCHWVMGSPRMSMPGSCSSIAWTRLLSLRVPQQAERSQPLIYTSSKPSQQSIP